jgi:antitoxin component YwqK of YwqJK toxin-antitoxin module
VIAAAMPPAGPAALVVAAAEPPAGAAALPLAQAANTSAGMDDDEDALADPAGTADDEDALADPAGTADDEDALADPAGTHADEDTLAAPADAADEAVLGPPAGTDDDEDALAAPAGAEAPPSPAPAPGSEPDEASSAARRAEGPVEVAEDGERVRTGAWVERAPDGRKLAEGRYESGQREGVWREWYPDGTPKLVASYEGGVAQGDLRCFHPNGEIERSRNELTTEDGLVLWVESRFDEAGRRVERSQYENGTREGPQRTWDGMGALRSAGSWSGGQKHGSWVYWGEDGERTRHEVWDHGRRLIPPARLDDAQ